MKGSRIVALSVFLILGTATAFAWQEKPTMAVENFRNGTDGDVPDEAITAMMTTEVTKSGAFTVLERENLDAIAREQRLGQSGLMEAETSPKIGRLKGARYILTGTVTQYHYQTSAGGLPFAGGGGGLLANTAYVTLDVRVFDTDTSVVVYTASKQGAATQTVGGLITRYGGFGTGRHGGLLAAATYKAVRKVVADLIQ